MVKRNFYFMKKFCVYKHIFPNGKMYIGITSKKPKERWENGFSGYTESHQNVMYKAICKYGWENVKHDILFSDLTEEEAKNKEKELISELHTYIHDPLCNGYNMTLGGEGTLGHKPSKEARKRMSESHKGNVPINSLQVVCNEIEYRSVQYFSEVNGLVAATVRKWLDGKNKMPIEWFEKGLRYKEEELNKNIKPQDKNKRQIYYNGKIFNKQSELARELGVSPSGLCLWLNGTNPIPLEIYEKGFYIVNEDNSKIRFAKNKKCLVKYDNKIYKTQRELAKFLNVDYRTLNNWLKGKIKTPQVHLDKGLELIKQ